ncbi:MAG: DUF4062 domain-containing protein [Nitrospinae bacterium]|nr:DUF4062 domain-containing protein [Nitrospinota bacterium]
MTDHDFLGTAPPGGGEPRMIRVFLSSTFRDMHEERNELVRRVFPELERRLARRMVGFAPVDLRWGITAEEAERGNTLAVCLDEIDRCYPYFIGLLGERYGWVPPHADDPAYTGRSITEIEIVHGALEREERRDNLFFYFRSREASRRIEERLSRVDGYEAEHETSAVRLEALKERIRATGFFLREGYPDAKTLGRWVLDDLWRAFDRQYPEAGAPSPQEGRRLDNEAFAAARTKVYIPRQEAYARIDEAVTGAGKPLVLTGPSGMGKSALLANWAAGFRRQRPDHFLSVNFIGSDADTADHLLLMRGVMGQIDLFLARAGGEEGADDAEKIPTDPQEIITAFPRWLAKASRAAPVVVVIDALNQLTDRENAHDLDWLPRSFPENVRLILSTLPGRCQIALAERGWDTYEVTPLTREERGRFIDGYLTQYGKRLDERRRARVVEADQTSNPLFLRTLLEELRLFGVFEEIDGRLDTYLAAPTVAQLYTAVLARFEADHEQDAPGLTRKALSLIWASRGGLSEREILDLVGEAGAPLPHAYWSGLYLALVESLVNRSGLLTFFHDFLRQAVESRYLSGRGERRAVRRTLAEYFLAQEPNGRAAQEAPWLLDQLDERERLHRFLADSRWLPLVWEREPMEVRSYWAGIERDTLHRMEESYRPVIERPHDHAEAVWSVASLMQESGRLSLVGPLLSFLVDQARREDDGANLAGALSNLANHRYLTGDAPGALDAYREAESLCRARADQVGLQRIMGNRGLILQERGAWDEAFGLFREKERICRSLDYRYGLIRAVGAQAVILQHRGAWEESALLLAEQERMARESGDFDQLAVAVNNQAVLAQKRGDREKAANLYRDAERMARKVGDRQGIVRALTNRASLALDQDAPEEALPLYAEAILIGREIGDGKAIQNALGGAAVASLGAGDTTAALGMSDEQVALCRNLGDPAALARALGIRGSLLEASGSLSAAIACYAEEAVIVRERNDRAALAVARNNEAHLSLKEGRLADAEAAAQEAGLAAREADLEGELRRALGTAASVALRLHRNEAAQQLLREEEDLAARRGERGALELNLGHQAAIALAGGESDRALALLERKEALCRELGGHEGLIVALFNQASIRIKEKKGWPEALRKAEEAAVLARTPEGEPFREKIAAMLDWLRPRVGEKSGDVEPGL